MQQTSFDATAVARLTITYVVQMATAFLVLASSLLFFLGNGALGGIVGIAAGEDLRFGIGLVVAAAGLWFLLPGLFNQTLEKGRVGIGRFLLNLLFLIVLIYVLLLAYAVFRGGHALAFEAAQRQMAYALLAGYIVGYLYSFYLPGRAFSRHDFQVQVPEVEIYSPPRFPLEPAGRRRWHSLLPGLALLGVILAGVFGYTHAKWLPAPPLLQQTAEYWQLLVAGACFVCAVAFFGMAPPRQSWLIRSPTGAKVGLYLATMVMAALAVAPAATKGLPWLASFAMTAKEGSAIVIVQEIGADVARLGCNGTAIATYADMPEQPVKLCEIPQAIWETLRIGDRLWLGGPQTRFGLRYESVRNLGRNPSLPPSPTPEA